MITYGDWAVLAVAGELDLFSCSALRDRVHAVAAPHRSVALDLSDVSFVDSSGLGAVIGALKHVTETGGRFAVIAPEGSALMRLLSLTGLDQVLPSLASREGLEVVT